MDGKLGANLRGDAPSLVSICIPAYNAGHVLGLSLSSILAQTWPSLEIILIDDGSSDDTSEVVRSVVDTRVVAVRNEKNRGGYQTMNQAVSLARGDFVAIYHADDVYEPTIVEKEASYLQSHPEVGAVFCLDQYIDDDGKVFGGTSLPREFVRRTSLTYADVFPYLVRHKNTLLRCPTFMARREVLEAVGPFQAEKYDIAADLDMWIRVVRQFPIAVLNERLMRYRVSRKQWSARYRHRRTEPELYFAIMDHYLQADGWLRRLGRGDLGEYAFHRCDDDTFRAANMVLRGDLESALDLLRRPYPWSALATGSQVRRKLRVLLWRAVMRGSLKVSSVHPLAQLCARLAQ